MKKIALGVFLALSLTLSGCGLGDLLEGASGQLQDDAQAPTPRATRVYMDEFTGPLSYFDGSNLTLLDKEGDPLTFDISHASLECAGGILGLDEVSIIYEGRPEEGDYSDLKILKVSDDLHKHHPLQEYTLKGTLTALTPYSATVETKEGSYQLPITGRYAYFASGIRIGMTVFLHCMGDLNTLSPPSNPLVLVKSISDQEPIKGPEPTPVRHSPNPLENTQEQASPQSQTQQFLDFYIEELSANHLKGKLTGVKDPVDIDLTEIPTHFPGGALPGTKATITYSGTYNGTNLSGLMLIRIDAELPRTNTYGNGGSLVKGIIIGSTADTLTLACPDGTYFTFRKKKLYIQQGIGEEITVAIDPCADKPSTIYDVHRIV